MGPQLIAGRYRVEREIGRGGMGTVWLCHDEVLGREVALKQMGRLSHESPPDRARALREARATAAIDHRNVVSVFDVAEEGDTPWLVMEYVPSRTLADLLSEGPMEPERAAHLGAQVADGLVAAHELGIVHRDVKPGNILVTEDDVAKISDFGIARRSADDRLTSVGLVAGTPSYFSPELARGADPAQESDVWALGVTLWTAVEGHQPYPRSENVLALLRTIASEPPPPPRRAGPLAEPIARMMDPDPRRRWSMADAAHALRRVQRHPEPAREPEREQETVPVPVAAPGPRPAATTRRRPGGLALAGIVALALLLLGGLGALLLRSGSADAPQAGPTPAPATTAPSTPPPSPRSTSPSPSPSSAAPSTPASPPTRHGRGAAMVRAVDAYYAMMPRSTDVGWSRLAPRMQADVGRDAYESFWGSIDEVESTGTTPVRGEPAVVTRLTYHFHDGRVVVEHQRVTLERSAGRYLIADDTVLDSRTVRS